MEVGQTTRLEREPITDEAMRTEYYRGELTPYGRRCLRFEEKEERTEEAFLERAAKILLRYRTH